MPPSLARVDSFAMDLHWDGDTFVDAEGHDVSSGFVHGAVLTLVRWCTSKYLAAKPLAAAAGALALKRSDARQRRSE